MSKNFAEEYKALANEELPDLWNRIEAGLTPKTTALAEEEPSSDMGQTIKSMESEAEQEAELREKQEAELEGKPEKGKVIRFLFRYRTVVAAAICVVVILPAAILMGRINRSKSLSGSAADMEAPMDNAATTEMWDNVAEEAVAEEPEESEAGVAAVEDMTDGIIADAAGVLPTDMDGAAVKEMQRERSSAGAISEAAADDAEEELETLFDKQKTEKIFERITIEAAEQTGETVETESDFYYGVEMKVISDPSGELQEGTKIMVWVSMLSSVAYVQGEEYELDLSYDSDRECPYQVKKNYFS